MTWGTHGTTDRATGANLAGLEKSAVESVKYWETIHVFVESPSQKGCIVHTQRRALLFGVLLLCPWLRIKQCKCPCGSRVPVRHNHDSPCKSVRVDVVEERKIIWWHLPGYFRVCGTMGGGCRAGCDPKGCPSFGGLLLLLGGGGGVARGHGFGWFAFGGAYWPLATAHSDPLWVRTCVGCVNRASG